MDEKAMLSTSQVKLLGITIESNLKFISTVNPRISPLGAYLFLAFLDGGLFEGGLYEGGGAYKIFEDKLHGNNKFQSTSVLIIYNKNSKEINQ